MEVVKILVTVVGTAHLVVDLPQLTTSSLCLSMMPSSCFRTSWLRFSVRCCTKFS